LFFQKLNSLLSGAVVVGESLLALSREGFIDDIASF
jgi:hypothetical protein